MPLARLKRRQLVALLGGAAAWPLMASAQDNRIRRLGILLFQHEDRAVIRPCLDELRALGYVDGKTITIDYRDAEGVYERLPALAAELVRLRPDVIFSFGGEQAPIVKQATSSIPIVVVVSNDPVASGLVASLARPGGNITGVTYINDQLAGKQVQFLKDAAPSVSRAAILWNPNHTDPEFRETERAAQALGLKLQSLEVRQPVEFEAAFDAIARERPEALIVLGSRLLHRHRRQIGEVAARHQTILVGVQKWLLEVGALLTYGPNPTGLHRAAASYVDRIFKGAKPADLPMQQPATFELTINLKAAQTFGIGLPSMLLVRADDVIR